MDHLKKEVEVAGKKYVVLAVDAQTQYKIWQKLAKYGAASFVGGMVKAEADGTDIRAAYVSTILAVIQAMPEGDQDFCINSSLQKTSELHVGEPVDISLFAGRIAEWIQLGVRAIGVQLGDFSSFLSLIPKSAAEAQEVK